jgi:voltage-gated potassium channel
VSAEETLTTAGNGPGSVPASDARRPAHVRRSIVIGMVRMSALTAVLFVLYALAPLGRRPDGAIALELLLCLLVFAAVLTWQIRSVARSTLPGLRAVEAVAVSLPLLIVVFASAYFVTGTVYPASFTQPMTKVDTVYFTVTVLATVGFGDIAPVTQAARIMVTVQMLADLLLIGIFAKVLLNTVQRRRQSLGVGSSRPPVAGETPL